MKKLAAVALLLLAAQSVSADGTAVPEYSRESLQRTFMAHVIELGPRPAPRVRFPFGAIEFRALGMDWRLVYLPVMMPLSGTRPVTSRELPDPLLLMGVEVPGAPPAEIRSTPRELRAELKRIGRVTR